MSRIIDHITRAVKFIDERSANLVDATLAFSRPPSRSYYNCLLHFEYHLVSINSVLKCLTLRRGSIVPIFVMKHLGRAVLPFLPFILAKGATLPTTSSPHGLVLNPTLSNVSLSTDLFGRPFHIPGTNLVSARNWWFLLQGICQPSAQE